MSALRVGVFPSWREAAPRTRHRASCVACGRSTRCGSVGGAAVGGGISCSRFSGWWSSREGWVPFMRYTCCGRSRAFRLSRSPATWRSSPTRRCSMPTATLQGRSRRFPLGWRGIPPWLRNPTWLRIGGRQSRWRRPCRPPWIRAWHCWLPGQPLLHEPATRVPGTTRSQSASSHVGRRPAADHPGRSGRVRLLPRAVRSAPAQALS